jgi:hypothetical protein
VNQEGLDGVDNEVRTRAGILPLVVEADLSFVGAMRFGDNAALDLHQAVL